MTETNQHGCLSCHSALSTELVLSQAAAGLLLLALSLLPGHWGYRWLPYMVSSYVDSGIQTPVLVLLRQVLPTEPPSPTCADFKVPPMCQTWTACFISSSFSGLLFSFPALHENLTLTWALTLQQQSDRGLALSTTVSWSQVHDHITLKATLSLLKPPCYLCLP